MEGGMSDVITLSSDEETECPKKKLKVDLDNEVTVVNEMVPNVASKAYKALHRLNHLTEIRTIPITDNMSAYRRKAIATENSVTIILDAPEKNFSPKSTRVEGKDHDDDVVMVEAKTDTCTTSNGDVVNGDDPVKESSTALNTKTIAVDDDETSGNSSSTEIWDLPEDPVILKSDHQNNVNLKQSTSKPSNASAFDTFLTICSDSVKSSTFARLLDKFPKMKQHFETCQSLHNDAEFATLLEHHSNIAKSSAADAVCSFQKIYSHLKDNVGREGVEIEKDLVPRVKKLEKTIRLLVRKLKQLEEKEVDWDDESDSSYLQVDRYAARLRKVHTKYCQLLNQNPYSGRLLYEKLNFKHSNYSEINKAINKAYKHNEFPNYSDIEKIISKCVAENNLALSENQVKIESGECFAKLGNVLQMRRKTELYDTQAIWLPSGQDPAASDTALNSILQQNSENGEKKLQEIMAKYVRLQEDNAPVQLSEDSDDSNYQDSDGSDA